MESQEALRLEKVISNPIEKLNPREFEDADGTERQLYTFETKSGHRVQAVFYSKEDLPYSEEVIAGRQVFIFGDAPRERSAEEWNEFLDDVSTNSSNKKPQERSMLKLMDAVNSDNSLFFVENSPENILDFAFTLGAESKELREARRLAVVEGRYSQEVLEITDGIIAAAIVDEEDVVKPREDQSAEALAVLKIMGDGDAEKIISQKIEILKNRDKEFLKETRDYTRRKYEEGKKEHKSELDDLGLTHITRFKPKKVVGGYEIVSSFDATGGESLRNTVHFYVGQPVESHAMGSWEDAPYVISGKLSEIVEANRDNVRLRTVSPFDTFFTVSPGTVLFIPEGHLTRPGNLEDGVLREDRSGETVYKSVKLTSGDINAFLEKYWDGWSTRNDESQLYRQFERLIKTHKALDYDFKKVITEKFFDAARKKGIEGALEQLIDEDEINVERDEVEETAQDINKWLVSKIRNGTMFSSSQMRGRHNSEGMEMLAYKLGAHYDDTMMAHFHEGIPFTFDRGTPYTIFKEIEREREEHKKPHDLSRCPHFILTHGYNPIIRIDDRKAVMGEVKKQRARNAYDFDVNVRRMAYLAGII